MCVEQMYEYAENHLLFYNYVLKPTLIYEQKILK